MTKAATIETHRLLALLIIVAMLAAMVPIAVAVFPGGVLAGDNSTVSSHVTCTFEANNGAPIVNSVTLTDTGDQEVPAMSPQTEYEIKVDITDNNTLVDIETITVYLYYDADGIQVDPVSPTADNQTFAIMTWDNTTTSFLLDSGHSGSSWALDPAGVEPANFGVTNGVWEFHVTISKVAKESVDDASAEWHLYALADDGTGTGHLAATGEEMNWYGEITGVTASIDWGAQMLGSDNVQSGAIAARYYSNGEYDEQVCAETTWTKGGDSITLDTAGNPGPGEFSLIADDSTTKENGIQVTGSYQPIDVSGAITTEAGDLTSNRIWLTLGHSAIPAGVYTGQVYFKINNGSP